MAAPTHRSKRRKQLTACLTIWVLKWTITLVLLNFYWGSQIGDLEKISLVSLGLVRHEFDLAQNSTSQGNSTLDVREDLLSSYRVKGNASIQNSSSDRVIQRGMFVPNLLDGSLQGKERLWEILQTRNVTKVDAAYWASLPSWDDILQNLYSDRVGLDNRTMSGPIIYGLETCQLFQNRTSSNPYKRRIAPAGLFNTGTNYLSVLLEYNCQNPHRVSKFHGNAKRGHGNEWEVLWGKHTPASYRGKYYKNKKADYDIDELLPVVMIRSPYGWMKSMCRNPYTANWEGKNEKACPQLKLGPNREWNAVDAKFGAGSTHHSSLAHMWNDWNGEYFYTNYSNSEMDKHSMNQSAPFPRLMVRFEDIIFYPYEVTEQICTCAGGQLGHRPDDKDVAEHNFHYVVRNAKTGGGHGSESQNFGIMYSWDRYGRVNPKDNYNDEELRMADEALDPFILNAFGYG